MTSKLLYPLVNALFLASLLSFSHALLKWISIHKTQTHWQVLFQYWWIAGTAISIYVFIFFYYSYVLRSASISVLYPVYTGLSIVFVFVIGVFFFQEPWTWQHVAGCLLIIAGIFLVSGLGS